MQLDSVGVRLVIFQYFFFLACVCLLLYNSIEFLFFPSVTLEFT
jgi:hypothetical protein